MIEKRKWRCTFCDYIAESECLPQDWMHIFATDRKTVSEIHLFDICDRCVPNATIDSKQYIIRAMSIGHGDETPI